MTQNGSLSMKGELKTRLIRAPQNRFWWKLRNSLRWEWIWGWISEFLARWFSKITGYVTFTTTLEAKVRQLNVEQRRHYESLLAEGRQAEAESYYERYAVWHNFGVVGRRSVTNAGVTFMRDDFNAGGQDITNFRWHTSGSLSTAENVTDTTLGAQAGQWGFGSQGTNGSNVYQTVATLSYPFNMGIVEHGIFSGSSAGTLWDRTVFGVITVAPADSIAFTYNLTINAGG